MSQPTRDAVRISLVYLIVSAGWIAFSDSIANELLTPEAAARLQTFKGLFFVSVTALLLFWLIRRSFKREDKTLSAYGESQHRWRELVENTNDAVIILDGRRIIYANTAAASLIGADDPTVPIGQDISSFLAAEDVEEVERRIGTVAEGGTIPARPLRVRRIDGSERMIEAHSTSIRIYDYPVVLSILVDVTDRLERKKVLIRAKEEAEQLAQMKTTILHNMSHEIRTPLTGILGISEILIDETSGDARDLAVLLHDSGWRLMRTLESILTLAQLETDTIEFHFEAVNVVDACSNIVRMYEPKAREKDIRMELIAPDDGVWVRTDPAALDQILMNVVSNAIKFTEDGGVIVKIAVQRERARVTVEDTGVGISPSFMPHVFDEYRQESQGMTRDFEGSGLGMTIVKRLIEKTGGEIAIESEKGVGTTVHAMLPLTGESRSRNVQHAA